MLSVRYPFFSHFRVVPTGRILIKTSTEIETNVADHSSFVGVVGVILKRWRHFKTSKVVER